MNRTKQPAFYRLAFYDPTNPDAEPEFTGPMYSGGESGRRAMADVIARYNELSAAKPASVYCLAAFPVDEYGTPVSIPPASKWRTFYRLALMNPRKLDRGSRPEYFGPVFEDTPFGRAVMKVAIREWRRLRRAKHRQAVVLLRFKVLELPANRACRNLLAEL